MAGFKIADVYAEVKIQDQTQPDIVKIESKLQGIEDKIVDIKAEDNASPIIAKITNINFTDKGVEITADDHATDVIQKVDDEKPDDVVVPVKADDQTESALAGIGGKMKGWAAAAGAGVAGILGGALAVGLGQANIVAGFENQMGVTPSVAQHYGQVAGQVFGQGFTSSKELISDALSALSSDMEGFGQLTTEQQEKIAGKAVKVSENFGDLNTIMQAASNMVANGLAPSFDVAFDQITVGMQNAGSRGDDLLETFREYPGFFKQLGFDGSQSLDLLNRMVRAGAQDTDKAADAVKEFGVLAVEAGGTAAPVFQALGFNAEEMARTIAAGGDGAQAAFLKVVSALQAVEDPAKRSQYAVGLFGTQSEDTMTRLLPKLDLTDLGMQNVAGAADRLKSTLTPMEQVTNAFGEAMAGLAPIVIPVIKLVSDIAGVLGKVAKGLDDVLGMAPKGNGMAIAEVFEKLKTAMHDTVNPAAAVQSAMRDMIGTIEGGAGVASKFGVSVDDMLDAVNGGGAALDKWNAALDAANKAGGDDAAAMNDLNGMLGTLEREHNRAADAVLAEKGATDQGTASKKDNASAARDAASATNTQTDAIFKLQDAVLGSINKDIGYRQSVIATKDAQKEATDAIKAHGAKSQEATEAGLSLESAQVRQAQAARDLAQAHSRATDETGRSADASRAYTQEVINMAVAAGNNATPALRSMIGSLSEADLKAAGATRSIDGAGNAVIRLPNGKEIKVEAKDLATQPIENIANKKYTATIQVTAQFPAGSLPYSQGRLAHGGPIIGPGTGTSDEIPIMASNGEYMIREREAKKPGVKKLLDLVNAGRLPGFADGGEIGYGSTGGQPWAMPAAGDTYNTYITAPPEMDLNRLADRVSRKLELNRRNRR